MKNQDFKSAIAVLQAHADEEGTEIDDNFIRVATGVREIISALPDEEQVLSFSSLAKTIVREIKTDSAVALLAIIEKLSFSFYDKCALCDARFTVWDVFHYPDYEDILQARDALFSFEGERKWIFGEESLALHFEYAAYRFILAKAEKTDGEQNIEKYLRMAAQDRVINYSVRHSNLSTQGYELSEYKEGSNLVARIIRIGMENTPDLNGIENIQRMWQISYLFPDDVVRE